jgi:hypothetical protein
MDLQVIVDPGLPAVIANGVSFECGATPEQTRSGALIYEHHGEGFTTEHQGSLPRFFEDVASGRKIPQMFGTHAIRDVDTIFAIALFLNRDLALVPNMVGLVAQMDLIHRRGMSMLAHIDPYMVGFVRLLRDYFPEKLSRAELGQRIERASGWIRELVTEGSSPAIGRGLPEVRIIDRGTNGFVVAETMGDLVEGWVVLFSMGFIRGVLVGPEKDGRYPVLAARKSPHVALDLNTAAKLLNDVESAMGEPPEWNAKADWLFGPTKGTMLTLPHLMEVFLRV